MGCGRGRSGVSVRAVLLLTLVCFLWALNQIVSKVTVTDLAVPPIWFAALRSIIVTLALLPWLRPLPDQLPKVMATAFMISGGSFALNFAGLQYASPSTASIVALIGAPLTVIFAVFMLGERVRWRRSIGIALAFIGVGVAMLGRGPVEASYGVALIVAATVLGALGSIMLKQLELGAIRLQAWAGLTSSVALVPLSLLTETGQLAVLTVDWRFPAALLFSALIVSVFGHTLYFRLLKDHDANTIVPLTLMTPVFTVLLGAWLTNDAVGPWLIGGGLIAMAGVAVILVRPSATLFKPLLVRMKL